MTDKVKHIHKLSELSQKQNDYIWYVGEDDSIYTFDNNFETYIIRDISDFDEITQAQLNRKRFTETTVKLYNAVTGNDDSIDTIIQKSMREDPLLDILGLPRFFDNVDPEEGELP
jgi:hypothetical protein